MSVCLSADRVQVIHFESLNGVHVCGFFGVVKFCLAGDCSGVKYICAVLRYCCVPVVLDSCPCCVGFVSMLCWIRRFTFQINRKFFEG